MLSVKSRQRVLVALLLFKLMYIAAMAFLQ